MKKIISLVTALTMSLVVLTGCSSGNKTNTSDTAAVVESQGTATEAGTAGTKETESSSVAAESTTGTESTAESTKVVDSDKVYNIGVIQLIEHPALDSAYEGFVDGLAEAGYVVGENLKIDYSNAQGDQSNAVSISTKLVNDNKDLILAIATPAAQAVANATADIPVLVTAVTDLEEAGLVDSNEVPGGNITGTSDLTPVKEQIELLKELMPEAQSVAVLYSSSEINSKLQADMAEAAAKEVGLSVQHATVSNSNEIQQVVQSLVGKVDAIYVPTDNIIANGMETVSMIATDNGIPIICGEDGLIEKGALATRGISYYELGKQTGAMAAEILSGEATPAEMPVQFAENITFVYNEDVAEELGITIPEDLK